MDGGPLSSVPAAVRRGAIDLNADVGEGAGEHGDGPLLELMTSASVACGGHAGDATTMRVTCALAAARGVRLGAHVSYRDEPGFGRRELDEPAARVADEAAYQLGALVACAALEGAAVRYVKPHGALYGRANRDAELAAALVAALAAVDATLAVMTPPGSELARAASAAGLAVIAEGFADRGYAPDGALLSRAEPGAVLGVEAAAAQAVALATTGAVRASDGSTVTVVADSLCVHSDTPGAVAVAIAVRAALARAGVRIAPDP